MKNRKTQLFTIIFICIFGASYSQVTFQKTFGTTTNEISQKTIPTFDNGYCILGSRMGFLALNKIDSAGNVTWSKQYSISSDTSVKSTHFASVSQTNDNGYIICGLSNSFFSESCGYLLKTDSAGNVMWCNTYDSITSFNSVKMTYDHGYIMAGQRKRSSGNLMQIIQKTDSTGQVEWIRSLETSNYNYSGLDVIQLKSDSSFIMIGYGSATSAILFSRFDKTGVNMIAKVIGAISGSWGVCDDALQVLENYSGNINISGSWGSTLGLVEVDPNGNVYWASKFYLRPWSSSFTVCKDKGVLLSTFFDWNGSNPFTNIILIKIDSTGIVEWQKSIGGIRNDYSSSIYENPMSQIIISGTTQNFNTGLFDYYLIKTDSSCSNTCNINFNASLVGSFTVGSSVGWGQTVGFPTNSVTLQIVSSTSISLNSYDACGCIPPTAGFSAPVPSYSNSWGHPFQGYEFPDSSTWVNNWYWDFGDGVIDSTNINPIHNYSTFGTYNVCLTVSNQCGSDTFCQVFINQPLNVQDYESDASVSVYPNPFCSSTTLKCDTKFINATLFLYNIEGQKLRQIENLNGETITLNRENLKNGIYIILIKQDSTSLLIDKLIITDN